MAAGEVIVQDLGPGRAIVTVDGWRVPGVRAVTVSKRVNDRDLVTLEILSARTTVLPAETRGPVDPPRPLGHHPVA